MLKYVTHEAIVIYDYDAHITYVSRVYLYMCGNGLLVGVSQIQIGYRF